jgi:hypothetical protein
MTRKEALYQSLASCGATLIAFIGTVHETVGAALYPWAPRLFGIIGFHVIGVSVIMLGLLMLGGTLRLIRFPVVALALVVSAGCAIMLIFIAVTYRQFHYFALCTVIAGVATALCFAKGEHLRAVDAVPP